MFTEADATAVVPGSVHMHRRTSTRKIQIAAGFGERQSAHGAGKGRRAFGGREWELGVNA